MQLNHHCILSFGGQNWAITRLRPGLIDVMQRIDRNTVITNVVDTRGVDWDAYCETARIWDERRFR